ncbi:DUF2569 domain-containing protein [Paenibacillus oenotherae]|uniref:DUF2569 domain-containing protein n=1 Tax=Paenibacillus oenotherae TaxID=1435645 RepID=A0ABS7D2W9_9BACL|nr:DUF2569 family protein [Paenibacillus oenotherae]MBW7474277.1 DUF2569 domain-containing protein [Paenibacillus oenotherae]
MDIAKQSDQSKQKVAGTNLDETFYYDNIHLKGLGGWLIIVHIALWLFLFNAGINLLLVTLPKIIQLSKYSDPASPLYDSTWAVTIPFQFIGNFLIILSLLVLLVKFVRRRSNFPRLFIIFNIGVTLFYFVDLVLLLLMTTLSDASLLTYVSALLRQALLCVLWIAYFARSKRVKVTFIR